MTLGRKKALDQYGGVATTSEFSSPHRLVQMLMEGALDKIAAAKGQLERNDLSGKSANISSAMAIINALKSSLDMKSGGEIAANLSDLYGYMYNRLIDANSNNETQALTEVSSLMAEIKTGWDAMPEEIKNGSANQASANQESGASVHT